MPYLTILLVLLLTGCSASGGDRPTGDSKGWVAYNVQAGKHVISFALPPNESKEFPIQNIPRSVDLESSNTFDEANVGPVIIERNWDYRKSFGDVDGSLRIYMQIRRSTIRLLSDHALMSAIVENNRLWALQRSTRYGDGGPQNKPVHFTPLRIAGRNGLRVGYEISNDVYSVRVDDWHYLSFNYGEAINDPVWKRDALAAANSFVASIRIE